MNETLQQTETSSQVDGSGRMFDRIATRYDLLNRLMSLGLDRAWRRRAVGAVDCDDRPQARILDLATGTADLALSLARAYPMAKVIGLDPSNQMLAVARRKSGATDSVELVQGDAQDLQFEDDSFDAVTIAFGIRNVPDRRRALREMARVVRPNGRVVILELCEPRAGLLGWPARLWVHHIVPRLGSWLSGEKEYRYLQTSIAAFPPPAEFASTMRSAGLEVLRVQPMTFRAVCLFVARPEAVSSDRSKDEAVDHD